MKIAAMHFDLHVPTAHSLKDKRQIIRSLKDKLFSHFNVSVAEVGCQDKWQRAEIGVAQVCIEAKSADASMRKIENFVRSHPGVTILEIQPESKRKMTAAEYINGHQPKVGAQLS